MDKHKKTNSHLYADRQEKRLTTAPIKERTKYTDLYKNNNLQLPILRGKNMTVSRQGKKTSHGKRDQVFRNDFEVEEGHKRPQTSKGSRNMRNQDSQFYEDEGDDLFLTTMDGKIDMFKKASRDIQIPVYKS